MIMKVTKKDTTLMFHQFGHSEYARNIMYRYCIGKLSNKDIIKPLSIVSHRKQIEIDMKSESLYANKNYIRPFSPNAMLLS